MVISVGRMICSFINPKALKLKNEVVSHYRFQQLHVGENYSYWFIFFSIILKYLCLNTHVVPNNLITSSDNKMDLKLL